MNRVRRVMYGKQSGHIGFTDRVCSPNPSVPLHASSRGNAVLAVKKVSLYVTEQSFRDH